MALEESLMIGAGRYVSHNGKPPYQECLRRHAEKRAYTRFDLPLEYIAGKIIDGTAYFICTQHHDRSHWLVPVTPDWVAVVVYDEIRAVPATVLFLERYQRENPTRLLEQWLEHRDRLANPIYRENRRKWTEEYFNRRAKKRIASALHFVGRGRKGGWK